MRVPIIMPQLGESIAEATIVSIAVQPGDQVTADQEIIEVETQKALLQVATPCAGQLVELLAVTQETYQVGATLGFVEASPEDARRLGFAPDDTGDTELQIMPDVEPGQDQNGRHMTTDAPARSASAISVDPLPSIRLRSPEPGGGSGGLPVPARLAGAGYLSPRLKARMSEMGLHAGDLAGVSGTGAGGRVTTSDMGKNSSKPSRRVNHGPPPPCG